MGFGQAVARCRDVAQQAHRFQAIKLDAHGTHFARCPKLGSGDPALAAELFDFGFVEHVWFSLGGCCPLLKH